MAVTNLQKRLTLSIPILSAVGKTRTAMLIQMKQSFRATPPIPHNSAVQQYLMNLSLYMKMTYL